jgi:hypothetical protein
LARFLPRQKTKGVTLLLSCLAGCSFARPSFEEGSAGFTEAAMKVVFRQYSTWIALVIVLLAPAAAAQRGSGSSTSSTSRSSPNPRTANTPDAAARPIFISGKVLLQGGGALPEPVPIERVCNGTVRREGYADVKGQFEFQLGVNLTFQDASEGDARVGPNSQSRSASSNGQRPTDLNGCELRAVLAGYQSSVVILHTPGGEGWQYEVGTIFLQRIGNAPGTTISVTSMAAPKDAMHAYEKAQKLKDQKPSEAEKQLDKAVKIYPQFAAAWTLMGDIHRERNEFGPAREEYGKAIAADPQFVNPNYGLAIIATEEKKYPERPGIEAQRCGLPIGLFHQCRSQLQPAEI